MQDVLKTVGAIIIGLSLLGAVIVLAQIDFEAYSIAAQVAKDLPTNEIAQARFQTAKVTMDAMVAVAVVLGVSGTVSGLLMMALGSILTVLTDMRGLMQRQSEPVPTGQSA